MQRAGVVGLILIVATGCETTSTIGSSEIGGFSAAALTRDSEFIAPSASMNGVAEATPAALAAPDAPPTTRELSKRLVVYSASLRVVVASTADARSAVRRIADDAGGFLQESDARSITVRVPAERFEPTVAAIERLGEVVDRAVKASDVSEQMLDLDVRLDNARATRDRLKAHLAKSEKMEDTIKLEAELARVTTEIELLEGKRRLLASQIAMSTVRVELNGSQPQTARGRAVASPFPWVAELGAGLVAGTAESMPRQPRWLARGPGFEPPVGFVRYFSSKDLVEAMNADGVRIKVERHDNFDRGPLDFWQALARRSLVETRALAVKGEWTLDKSDPWSTLVGTREVAGKPMTYLLAISRDNDDVYTYEAWGASERVDAMLPTLAASARTLRR